MQTSSEVKTFLHDVSNEVEDHLIKLREVSKTSDSRELMFQAKHLWNVLPSLSDDVFKGYPRMPVHEEKLAKRDTDNPESLALASSSYSAIFKCSNRSRRYLNINRTRGCTATLLRWKRPFSWQSHRMLSTGVSRSWRSNPGGSYSTDY